VACGFPNWDGVGDLTQFTKQHRLAVVQILAFLVLVGLFCGHYQRLTSGSETPAQLGLNGEAGVFLDTFGVLFAVLGLVAGFTMFQQSSRGRANQTEEAIAAVLKVTLAFGVLAFAFSCWHIHLGLPPQVDPRGKPLMIAIESVIIIDFFLTFFCYINVRNSPNDWACAVIDAENVENKLPSAPLGILETVFAIILVGLLAGEMQRLTENTSTMNLSSVGLNNAGLYMMGFGLIFAVFQAAAGFTKLEQMSGVFKGASANLVFVTSKVAVAIGVLAFGFACRHINLDLKNGTPQGATSSDMALVHAIESFLIINFLLAAAVELCSDHVAW